MAINEQARHELYQALEELLGTEKAATLMSGLSPEFEVFEARMDARFVALEGRMEARFGEVHLRIAEWGRTVVLANVATMVAAVSLAFAASRL